MFLSVVVGLTAMPQITLTFPDGSKKEFEKGATGAQIAEGIGRKLAQDALAIKVDDQVQSLFIPIEKDAKINILTWKDAEGKATFWHSTAHILAHAISRLYPNAKNTIGPPIEEGFFYDFDDLKITPDDFPKIEAEMQKIVTANFPFEKIDWIAEDVKKNQGNNPYKQELAKDFQAKGWKITAYKDGEFIDLCEGPHVPKTGLVKAFKLTKLAAAFWKGDQKNKQLTRVYGIGFPSKKELDEWQKVQEELAKRDHRKIGRELKLFMTHELSPGSPFFLPKGTVMYNELLNFLREEYVKRGYQEVITPQLFNKALWETSGHWEHYKKDMFVLIVDSEEFSLKPMNCPSHCLIYQEHAHSYRELPLRLADFCFLHRNELRGVLSGITRDRKFAQDDAHIFCTPDQIGQEIDNMLDFIQHVYHNVFKFETIASLSTKPKEAMGDAETWKKAEEALESALKKTNVKYIVKEGEGAFYGPKIDFDIKDALGRLWQMSTIQLDFQMPQRFKLTYTDKDNSPKTPVMIHRAILGSLERFLGILIENYAGKFPTWLSPVQATVLPLSDKFNKYAAEVTSQLRKHNIRVELDDKQESLNKKVRNAQLENIPYILVVGEKEQQNKSIAVRTRDGKVHGEVKIDKFIEDISNEIKSRK